MRLSRKRQEANAACEPLTKRWQFHQIIPRDRLQRKTCFPPCCQTAPYDERVESLLPQQKRHPGARGVARSSAVQVNVLVPGQEFHFLRQLVGLQRSDPLIRMALAS